MSYLRAMRRALPEEGVLVDEVTQLGFAARLAFPVYRPRSYFSPGSQDNLGWGFGTALGVKAALPDTPVLADRRRRRLPLSDRRTRDRRAAQSRRRRRRVRQRAVRQREAVAEREFRRPPYRRRSRQSRFRRARRSLGVEAHRANDATGLERALNIAFAADRPALVHVRCGEMPSPWDMILMPRVRGPLAGSR